MEIEKLYEWINKNKSRSTQPLYAWVDAVDLINFIKESEDPAPENE